MNLISKSIRSIDVQADDRLIERMRSSRYGWLEIRDIIIARYRNRNLRMRVLVAFNQMVKSKKLATEVSAAIKATDTEQSAGNVVCLDDARAKQDKAA